MFVMDDALFNDVRAALADSERSDLITRLESAREVLTSTEVAALLGVSSSNTVKNWLEGGFFPGAFKTPGGHWRFPRGDVEAAKARMEQLRAQNDRGAVVPPGDAEDCEPPLL